MSEIDLKTRRQWVNDAKDGLRQTKEDAWRCHEAVDGKILTDDDYNAMVEAGIDPLEINRIAPVVGLLSGTQTINRRDIIAKGRTSKDSQMQEIMTEGIAYTLDQNNGDYLISQEFQNQLKGGLGYLSIEDNTDPRQEEIKLKSVPWHNMWYDPFAPDPWLNPDTCRYCFYNPWMDLDELTARFPEKKREIEGQFNTYAAASKETATNTFFLDEGDTVEEERIYSHSWVNADRKRVRPVDMWYTRIEKTLFAVFADGSYLEITDDLPWEKVHYAVQNAQKIVPARVRKMWSSIFFGEIEMSNEKTKLPHDQFKFIPFVGYVDRFGFPYGVPMQLIGLNIEMIKRRSMALALLKSRRVLIEEDAAPSDDPNGLGNLHEESQKIDGFMVLARNALASGKIKIVEQAQLLQGQEALAQICEQEIKEISGANDEAQGWDGDAQSGRAMEIKIQRSATTTAQMFDNCARSQKMIGEQITAMIQGRWTGEKVLRITDSMTGAERFVELNKPHDIGGGVIEIRNNITQGRYDLIISEAQQTDTVRARNLTLLREWMSEATEEIKPILMSIAMEISDLPNKETIMAKVRPLLGMQPGEEDLTPEEIKEKQEQQAEAEAQKQQEAAKLQQEAVLLSLKEQEAKVKKLMAEAEKIMQELQIKRETADADNYVKGFNVGKEMRGQDAAQI